MANTSILIKRSTTTGRPGSLAAGEFAYSYQSNTLFIGSPSGTGVLNVGGQYYTSTLDAATAANTVSTLVKRDVNGAFAGNLLGSSANTYSLINSQNFSISGGDITASAVGFNGTSAVALNASLNTVAGLGAGVYGGTTAIPVVTVAANGRIMAIANTTIATSFTVSGNTGSGTQAGGGTLTIQGGNTGITTTVTGSGGSETVRIDTDNTVLRANTGGTIGSQIVQSNLTVSQDLTIQGNLTVLGSQTTINTSSIILNDPLIFLANNNYTSDAVDIGIIGHYNDTANAHTGIFRDPNRKEWIFFQGYTPEVGANNLINIADPSFAYANVYALNFKGNVVSTRASVGTLTLTNALTVPNGGTGATSFTNGSIVVGSGTGALTVLSNSTYSNTGTSATNATLGSLSVDAYGRVTAANWQTISGLTVSQGGTGASTFSAGGLLIGNGTGAISSLANTTFTSTNLGAANTINSVTVDAYGRTTAVSTTPIAIDTAQITSGTLGFARGGTGSTSYTVGQLLVATGSSLVSLANSTFTATGSGATNSTITSLTVDAYGRTTAATYSSISGLTVSQGGTGASTFTTNGITYGNGTGALQVTAAAGTSDQTYSNQFLTVTNAGVPVWASAMDGGQF